MSGIRATYSGASPPLRLVHDDPSSRVPNADERTRQLSARLEDRISSQLNAIRQRLADAGPGNDGLSSAEPGRILDVLA